MTDQPDPPTLVGRCQTCRHWRPKWGDGECQAITIRAASEVAWLDAEWGSCGVELHTAADFGCTL